MNRIYDLQEIENKLPGRIDELVMALFPEAKKTAGEFRLGDISGKPGKSFCISTKTHNAGVFYDYADPTCTGGPVMLVSKVKNLSIRNSIQWLASFLRVNPIQDFAPATQAKDHAALKKTIKPLTAKCLEYAKEERKISKKTLDAYGVGSGNHGDVIFPHYDSTGSLGLLKHWEANDKKNMWSSTDPIHTLFGKDVCCPEKGNQRLVITEGQWDALSLYEVGIPAVSIPSGVSNTKWITEDYEYLSTFHEIILIFDADGPGREAAKEAAFRLGTARCSIVELPMKDANEMLVADRGDEIAKAIETTLREPIAEIVDPEEMREDTRSYLKGDYLSEGDPFFLPNFDLCFRKHEVTLWFGFTSHGKSTALQNQMAFLAGRGEMMVCASFEQQPARTLGAVLMAVAARPNLPNEDQFDDAYDFISNRVFMYKSRQRTDPKHLIQTFVHAHRRYGITKFAVDNVMTLDVDRGDNTAQAEAMDGLREFVANYPVHLHIVAHPRKSPEGSADPPAISEIRGASEWGDMPDNILTVWRDVAKSETLEEMKNEGCIQVELDDFWKSTPCGKIYCRKQRATGDLPVAPFFFEKATKRCCPKPEPPMPMYEGEYAPWKK